MKSKLSPKPVSATAETPSRLVKLGEIHPIAPATEGQTNPTTTQAAAPQALVVVSTLPGADAVPAPGTFLPSTINHQPSTPLSGWSAVREYAEAAAKYMHGSMVAQVMAGFELLALHKAKNVQRGKHVSSSPIVGDEDAKSWPELVKENAGISRQTASNWMAMAQACAPRLRKLKAGERIKALLSVPPSQWSKEDSEIVVNSVRKLTDGRTQMDFLAELGLTKKPHGATGGARKKTDKQLTAEEEITAERKLVEDETVALFLGLDSIGARFTLQTDFQIEAQIARLDVALKARRHWISLPQSQRTPDAIAAIKEMLQIKTA